MTNQEIKELLEIFHTSGVAEMEVQRGENRLRLRRSPVVIDLPAHEKASPMQAPVAAATDLTGAALLKPSEPEPNHIIVKSPIVGTYFDAPSPEAQPFVKVGDLVEPGQALCIIESMKLMNEIEAEVAGEVVKIYVENGQPVEYGQPLFGIKK